MRLHIEVQENVWMKHYNSLSLIINNVLCIFAVLQFHCGVFQQGEGIIESLNDKPLDVLCNVCGMLNINNQILIDTDGCYIEIKQLNNQIYLK